jgi:hypothetical protein
MNNILNINSNYIYISGSIGIKIIENKILNKKIFIFYDDHSNNIYCNKINKTNSLTNYNIFISELFDLLINNTNNISLILEEPFINKNDKIKILWEDSKHLLLFRKFYGKLINKCSMYKICNTFPADIRLALFDISPDEIMMNISKLDTTYMIPIITYMKNLFYLFDLTDKFNIVNKIDHSSIIYFIKKVFNAYNNSDYYLKLKKHIEKFIEKFVIPNKNLTILELFKKEWEKFHGSL